MPRTSAAGAQESKSYGAIAGRARELMARSGVSARADFPSSTMNGMKKDRPVTQRARFSKFVEPHIEALRRAAYRMCRSLADAEDLVQDACLRAFERFPGEGEVEAPRAWLMRIQYNLHVDDLRRGSNRRTEPFDEPTHSCADDVPDTPGPDGNAETAERLEALGGAWPELNRDQQALLALYAEGYRLEEIGRITGLPVTALKARLRRARVRLGRLMASTAQAREVSAISGER